MAVDTLTTWRQSFSELPVAKTAAEGAQNLADWLDAGVTGLLVCEPTIQGPNITYTFDKATFFNEIKDLPVAKTADEGIQNFADAWNTAMTSSTALMAAGSSIGPPSNVTTWSVVSATVIDPPSVTSGTSKIEEIKNSDPAKTAYDSDFPLKFRDAHLLHTITTTGLDSTPPGSGGPLPLVDAARGVA